jgi:uncharacterized protein
MIIDIRTIHREPRHLDFVVSEGWWTADQEDDSILGFDRPMNVQATLGRTGDKYVLDGRLHGGVLLRCDRCLEAYHFDVEHNYTLFLARRDSDKNETEVRLSDADLSVDFITGEEVNVDDIIREQIYLSLPMKSLCNDNCAGLCPACGANLNKQKCGCLRKTGHPGFSALRNLKLKGEKI